jgi:hypothetical protein
VCLVYHGRRSEQIVDYYSKYPEFAKLENKTADCVINHTKVIYARHGIPEEVISDNIPFASRKFPVFAQ